MSRFQPLRSSPPSRPSVSIPSGVSPTSDSMIAELRDLSPHDVEILDTVIQRAGHTATTFLTVFKAYNEVLTERGLDAHEVVYYGKLLKLGTLKGRNWGEKWDRVKRQHKDSTNAVSLKLPVKVENAPLASAPSTSCSLESDQSYKEEGRYTDARKRQSFSSLPLQPRLLVGGSSLISHSTGTGSEVLSTEADSIQGPTTIKPFLRKVQKSIPNTAVLARHHVAEAKERRGTILNEAEAWKKIRMQQDEENADLFRQDRLLERCWDVWRQGNEWILSTNRQISEARDHLLLRRFLQRWQMRAAYYRDLHCHVASLSDHRCLQSSLQAWYAKLAEKRQRNWRHEMRSKMKIIRMKYDVRILKDAWGKWRDMGQLRLASQGYLDRLSSRFYLLWKSKAARLAHFSIAADEVFYNAQNSALSRSWECWKKATEYSMIRHDLERQIDLRIIAHSLAQWRQRLTNYEMGDHFYQNKLAMKALTAWKRSAARIRVSEKRALRHLARADDLLLHAVLRVWRAKQNGYIFQRQRSTRLQDHYWTKWNAKLLQWQQRNALALAFSKRYKPDVAAKTLKYWQRVHTNHQDLVNLAISFDATHLVVRILMMWKIRLRRQAKMVKTARLANRFFAVRRAWVHWLDRFDEIRRQQLLQVLLVKHKKKLFDVWLLKTRLAKTRKQAELETQERRAKRLIHNALTQWTNHVISIKLRELDVGQHSDMVTVVNAFQKWKNRHSQHIEERSLMESYLFVKQEESIRRVFIIWLAAARTARHRRISFMEKEKQLRQQVLEDAWGKWREHFIDVKLRPMEYEIILQCQRDTLCTTFALWHAKTKSPPAIRFQAVRIKRRFFESWRRALPRALRLKDACDLDRRAVSSRYFDRWVETYRTKKALKAVARARHLRLPAAPVKYMPALHPRPLAGHVASTRTQPLKPKSDVKDKSDDKSVIRRPQSATSSTYISLRSIPPSAKSTSSKYSKMREPSPIRESSSYILSRTRSETASPPPPVKRTDSIAPLDVRRRLWPGLHDIPRKSRPFFNPN